MSGSHTIVHRPVSNVFALQLTANSVTSPLQIVPTANELANFIYILNANTAPVLVNLKNNSTAETLAFPASGSNTRGFVVGSNSYIVIAAPTPICYVQALSTAAGNVFFQLLQNQ